MRNHKTLNRILVASLIVVWGSIAYQVVGALGDYPLHEEGFPPTMPARGIDRTPFTFPDDIRSPFLYRPPLTVRPTSATAPPAVSSVWNPPSLTLSGIIVTGARRVAILQDAVGTVHFTSAGEIVNGVKIIHISNEYVQYEYKGQQAKWMLDQNIAGVP